MFDEELTFFIENQDDLVEKHLGKILVLKGKRVIGVHENVIDAFLKTKEAHQPGTFMLQPCLPGPDAYTVTIASAEVATFQAMNSNKRPDFHAFTIKHNGISNIFITDIGVSDVFDPRNPPDPIPILYNTKGLWDTGATNSVLTTETIKAMGLQPVGLTSVNHAGGSSQSNTYLVNFVLPNTVGVAGILVTECPRLVNNAGALIGMDIISRGDFSITNAGGLSQMTFRVPSVAHIDYVVEARRIKYAGVGRNDPCPCGKKGANGKRLKFKKCCGKN